VRIGAGTNVHCINAVYFEQFVNFLDDVRDVILLGNDFCFGFIAVAERNNFYSGKFRQNWQMDTLRDISCADERNSGFIHNGFGGQNQFFLN
jgi:hypothetical protein